MEQQDKTSMGFGRAIKVCMKEKYACFKGRATRAEFWYFSLFAFLVLLGVGIVGFVTAITIGGIAAAHSSDPDEMLGVFAILLIIAYFTVIVIIGLTFLCPTISALVRRLHDTGRSGWWSLLCFTSIGGIVILVFTLLPSEEEDNEYGPYIQG